MSDIHKTAVLHIYAKSDITAKQLSMIDCISKSAKSNR